MLKLDTAGSIMMTIIWLMIMVYFMTGYYRMRKIRKEMERAENAEKDHLEKV